MDPVKHQLPTVLGLSKRTAADKEAAMAADKATHAELRALRSRHRENKSCADCTASLTGWASLPHGVFLCINCAQVHRSLGRHMAQVKSFSSGTYLWYPDEVAAMATMGNANANALYASPGRGAPSKPDQHAPAHEKERFIRDKYERLKWVDPAFRLGGGKPCRAGKPDGGGRPRAAVEASGSIRKPPPSKRAAPPRPQASGTTGSWARAPRAPRAPRVAGAGLTPSAALTAACRASARRGPPSTGTSSSTAVSTSSAAPTPAHRAACAASLPLTGNAFFAHWGV